ncbi:GDSL esterase/lipase At1g28580-like [Prosopis cineraria]|uniref:GDSL esterase/lipase At1g28580-like n=1 Tax=Prosopis cineraria TaxID=364024 RepID=UPI00240EB60B|nr:GDSL esterase/lipase At1g28580-like [Prosopis cineraria]
MTLSESSSSLLRSSLGSTVALALHVASLISFINSTTGCHHHYFTSIFSFGDSLADTGNLYFSSQPPPFHYSFFPPFGQSYFGRPTGRCSDGRLIVDFIAESLGIQLLKPYLGIKNGQIQNWTVEEGVNFAVSGATALNADFFEEKGIRSLFTNNSLSIQLSWFKELLLSLCNSYSSCKKVLEKSLFLVGEIGGNDFNRPLLVRRSLEEITTFVPHVINVISSTIRELIDLGAHTLMVPGNFPIGCTPLYLTMYESKDKNDYDEAGCLKWLNKFTEYYNERLQAELNQIQVLHPQAKIIYADYYNAALPLYHFPTNFGFSGLKACCGSEGPYKFNASSRKCGEPGVNACDDPSKYISWDGIHMTEAAHRWIVKGLTNEHCDAAEFSTLRGLINNNVQFECLI